MIKGIFNFPQEKNFNFYRTKEQEENFNFQPEPNDIQPKKDNRVSEDVRKIFQEAKENFSEETDTSLFQNDEDVDAAGNTHGQVLNPGASTHKAVGRKSSPAECETCANRTYQDGSNENDVSFKAPGHISPSIAATVVLGHEHEHVANAYEKEQGGNAKVQSVTVRLHNDICPECGRVYVAGGVTNTQIKYFNEDNPYQKEQKSGDAAKLRGATVDFGS